MWTDRILATNNTSHGAWKRIVVKVTSGAWRQRDGHGGLEWNNYGTEISENKEALANFC